MLQQYLLIIKTKTIGQLTVLLKYSELGELVFVEIRDLDTAINQQIRNWLWGHLPISIEQIKEVSQKSWAKVTKVDTDLSFEAFWNLYDYKVGNKKRAEKHWGKLDDTTRILALKKVREYTTFCRQKGQNKLFAERYLSYEYYNNDWKDLG